MMRRKIASRSFVRRSFRSRDVGAPDSDDRCDVGASVFENLRGSVPFAPPFSLLMLSFLSSRSRALCPLLKSLPHMVVKYNKNSNGTKNKRKKIQWQCNVNTIRPDHVKKSTQQSLWGPVHFRQSIHIRSMEDVYTPDSAMHILF